MSRKQYKGDWKSKPAKKRIYATKIKYYTPSEILAKEDFKKPIEWERLAGNPPFSSTSA